VNLFGVVLGYCLIGPTPNSRSVIIGSVPERLSEYKRKRDFSKTAEPPPEDGAQGGARFVVQEHHARRLHWDLRLEHDGVAASWAIPNGIPEVPNENRMAVHTEDHPLKYLDWEGDIPEGEYGAGKMRIWDKGTYVLEKWTDDKVTVVFHGERLHGRYALFKLGKGDEKDWMIHRMDPPEDPDREPMPERLVPMMAKLAEEPPPGDQWAFEIKWDGVRAIAYSEPGRLRLESRNLNDISAQYPELRPLNRALSSHMAVLDGEIVAFDEQGRPSFERLQQRMHLTREADIKRRAGQFPVVYVIFDLLYLDGHSLMDLPYEERRARLDELELSGDHWRTPGYFDDGPALLEASAQQSLEGIVAKRRDCPYRPGSRGGTWLKIKHTTREELVIGGWLPGEGRRRTRIGALLLGYWHDGGFRYAGKVGTGFTDKELDRLRKALAPHERETSPFDGVHPIPKGAQFVEPCLVAEIELRDWTSAGMLRAPSYKGLRSDKDPATIVLEAHAAAPTLADILGGAPARGAATVTVAGRELSLTNLDKVLYPKTGFTKGDVIDYYARISPVLLPHLHGRPLTLKRYPNGVDGQHFYEKNCPAHRPGWVQTAQVGDICFCLAHDLPTMVWLGNLADLELHTSLSLADPIERPTILAFDLDPGPPADIVQCCQVARLLRGMFSHLGLESFAKTSGSKGLQVYVPLNHEGITYDKTKPFARAVAETLEKAEPDLIVSRMTKALRPGKVLVDWSQNDEHKTTVNVYSLRARERPTVSTPVTWEEVEACAESGDASLLVFDSEQVLARVEEHGDLFAPVLSLVQELP
jgi:bifunctional non-homologous end joining protein LigD